MSRSLRSTVLLLGLGLSASTGCTNLEERTKYLTGPEAFEWESEERFVIRDEEDMWGQALASQGELSVFFRGFPPGTTLEVGTASTTADEDGYADVKTNIETLYGNLPTNAISSTEAKLEGTTMTITPPGKGSIVVPLRPLSIYGAVKDSLLKVNEGPVLFEGEQEGEGELRSVIWFHGIDQELIGGPAPKVADLDGVVFVDRPEGRTKACTGYTDDNGNPQPDVMLELRDTVVTIYERRTGRKAASKTFPPDEECPTWLTTEAGTQATRTSSEPHDDMRAWLEEQVGKA